MTGKETAIAVCRYSTESAIAPAIPLLPNQPGFYARLRNFYPRSLSQTSKQQAAPTYVNHWYWLLGRDR
jgi:hypothetical protein